MSGLRPNFLIAGAAKAGTTSLHEYVGQHPEIFMAREKEPHYFVKDFGLNDWEQYLGLFKEAGDKKIRGESSTGYLVSEESAAWIKKTLPEAKIVIMLRQPAARAFSLYVWMVREGYEDAKTFAAALEQEPLRMADPSFARNCPEFCPDYYYFTSGLYHGQVRRYLETFGRDRVLVLLFEEFVKEPLAACRRVFDFLEVQPDFIPKMEVHNEGRAPASIGFQYWLRTKAERRLRFISRQTRQNWIARLMQMNIERGFKPEPDPELRARLSSRYEEDIRQLEDLLQRDLSIWTKKSGVSQRAAKELTL